MSSAARPVLRGKVVTAIGRNLFIAGAVGVSCGLAYKYLVAIPRQKRYAEFYKTYDPEKSYRRMLENGYIQTLDMEENE